MKNNKLKELFTILIFSLFIFANPSLTTFSFDIASESEFVLEFEIEMEEENDKETKNTFFINPFSYYNFSCENIKPTTIFHLYTYKTNVSLLKPPILHS